MGGNSFLETFAQILFNRDVYGGLNSPRPPEWSYTTTPREVTGGNIRVRGVIPHQITLMSPLSHMAEIDQITQRLSCLDQWPVDLLQIHYDESQRKYTW